jgi:hypothetical protein
MMFALTVKMSYDITSLLEGIVMKQGFNEESHGHTRKHGMRSGGNYMGSRPKAYAAWVNMRQRCNNPDNHNYINYGGRGISYCKEWNDFAVFYSDMGNPPDKMTLDRIDNALGYFKENCRWATRTEQSRNKRDNVNLTYGGITKTLSEWAREFGIQRLTLRHRVLVAKWPVSRALTTPVGGT